MFAQIAQGKTLRIVQRSLAYGGVQLLQPLPRAGIYQRLQVVANTHAAARSRIIASHPLSSSSL